MKRCPECEFLYYDEQERCDIDGTRLQFTTKLPTAFAEAAQTKSMRGTVMISLLATIVLGVVLFIVYPPKWHTSRSSTAVEVRPASVQNANKNSQLPLPEASQNGVSTPSPKPAARSSRDPFAPMETRTERSASSVPATKPKVTIIEPANRSIEAKPATNQVSTAKQPSPVNPKPTTPSYSMSGPSVRPVAVATATPKPLTQNPNKDSKFNSMMKKAGRILKKPF